MLLNNVKNLTEYFDDLKLCPKGRTFIKNAIDKRARDPQATPYNKLFYYTSLKMGVVIVCEGEWEYQMALTLEYGDTLAYLDQPPTQYVKSPNKNGAFFGRKTTADFTALYEDCVVVYEVKPKSKLEKLHKENPEHIQKDESGNYYNPWAEKHFREEFGFEFKIVTDGDFNITVNGNWNFLQNYFHSNEVVPDTELKALTKVIRKDVGSTIKELKEDGIQLENIYRAIAKKQIHAPLGYRPITEHSVFRVFSSQAALNSFQKTYEGLSKEIQQDIELSPGAHLWLSASNEEKEEATYISKAVLHHRMYKKWPHWLPEAKHTSAYRWKTEYEDAESKYGAGILGVLPKVRGRGPRGFQGSQAVYDKMLEIKEQYWDEGNKKPFPQVYAFLSSSCDELGEQTPGEDTFRKFLKENQTEKSIAKRDGIKVAHSNAPPLLEDDFRGMKKGLFLLDQTAIDHTQCNIFILLTYMSTTIKLRPWITLLTDSMSRRVLGFYISLLGPSKVNVFMIMRRYLLEYGLVMRHLGVDGGPEFDSTAFNHWLPSLKAHKIRRCSYRSKGGTKVERPNKVITDCLFHFLQGNSQQTEFVRAMDPKLDPRKNAVWTLPRLYQIVEFFFKNIYHKNSIGKHGPSPDEIWNREYDKLASGILLPAPSKEIINLETCIPVKGETSKIDKNGVTAQYLPYWNEQTNDFKNRGKKCPTLWDPDNAGLGYTFLDDFWLQATNDYRKAFEHLDPLEILSRSQEIRYVARNTEDKRKLRLELNKKLNQEITLHEAELRQDVATVNHSEPKPKTRVTTAKGGLAERMGVDSYDAGELEFEDE